MTHCAANLPSLCHLQYISTGKERDAESGNDYFEARYYSSAMGRFMSPDWSAQEEPVPYAKLDDPQSLNLYAYVYNNPLARADVDGHCPWCIGAVVGAIGGMAAEVIADKISGKEITGRGLLGAAVGGAIVGGSMGMATGEGIAIGAAIAGTASITGGIAERTIKTGSLDKATENPGEIVADATVGAAIHVGAGAAAKLVGSLTSGGRAVAAGEKALAKTNSPKAYIKKAARLAAKEGALEKNTEHLETGIAQVTHPAAEAARKTHE